MRGYIKNYKCDGWKKKRADKKEIYLGKRTTCTPSEKEMNISDSLADDSWVRTDRCLELMMLCDVQLKLKLINHYEIF